MTAASLTTASISAPSESRLELGTAFEKGQIGNIFDPIAIIAQKEPQQYASEWAWLWSNKTLLTKASRRPGSTWGLESADLWSRALPGTQWVLSRYWLSGLVGD